ncbi:tetratricopeptide repeat protein 21B [Lingula anatina]|uniref:Tetratricopeptide repeat protein 21B n=1 Tax=Lingula anatina TaxID=7574 RepID=A0A1S3HYF2_LINAN|nr:tetratricopeptide repeat protein 21B [Lingula anatina]|eukprot:XP_013391055.1 tetratricopeptide repeat protein 21B [Lingula anatina]
MAETDSVTLAKINYYCREKLYRHMQNAALEGMKKYGNDPVLKFFHAYSMLLEDRVQEGMRELEILKDKRDLNLCTYMALMFGHKRCKTVDREAMQELDTKLKTERKQAGEMGLYFAGLFLFHSEKYDKAREYIDRMLKINANSKEGLILKGWIDLLCGRDSYVKKAVKYFDDVLNQGNKEVDALFGKAKCFSLKNNFTGSLELMNQAIVSFPGYMPALIEKMKIQLALQDWEQTVETAHRALSQDNHSLEAHRYIVLHQLCREGNAQEAATKIGDLIGLVDRFEPKNPHLYNDIAQTFCRLCGRNLLVLQQTYTLAERAVSLDNTSAEYVTELGYELLMQGRVRDAMKCYKNAMKLDETSVAALTGIIRCQLAENQLEDAAQQLEFLSEIQQSIGKSAEVSYLSAVLARKRQKGPEKVLELLNEAVENHFSGLESLPLGVQYFYQMNPDFLIQVIHEFLIYAPQQPSTTGQPVHPVLKRCQMVLEPVTRTVPGLLEALFLMAKVKFLSGDVDAAQGTLQHCLDQDSTFSDAHILMAQIQLHQGNFKQASQSLEVGLSYNFEVREHPLYHLIKARIQKKQGDFQDAVKTLQMAMSLPGVKKSDSKSGSKKKVAQIGINDRVSVFLELAEAHRMCAETHEAAKVMTDATMEFEGTPEEIRIMIANADLSLNRGDVEGALVMLRNVKENEPYFVQAREKMAEIYLHHRKDKRLYASCYKELVDKHPSAHTCLLLGDAYMSIQEPEKAIEVYQAALKLNPKDGALASKIGQALVKTHNYGKAINYYEAALKSGSQMSLRYDLAELLLKLRQYDKAQKVLLQALDQAGAVTKLEEMIEQTKYLVLLAKVHTHREEFEQSVEALNKARDMQARVLKRVHMEQPDAVPAQKQLAASICSQMAKHSSDQRDYEKAIKYYKEALVYNENDEKVAIELARLYMLTDDLNACQHQLMALLKNEKQNDAATVMMADLMFRKNDYDAAMFHFQQLLQRAPDHFEALARLVDLMRRGGKLDEVPVFLEKAETFSPKTATEPGYNYCKGLYEWHTGNPNNALKYFNKARKDTDWGQEAIYCMIEICLNPDNDIIGGEVFETMDNADSAAERADSEQLAVKTAEKLIKELRQRPGDIRPRLLENMLLIATKNKQNIEKALAAFMEIASAERDHVGALYGMAAAYMVLKQTPRARNQLRRIAKNNWNMQDAEDLEKCWLLLADIYIQNGKYDMATELLRKCLAANKSCCKAYEYMGFIMEREQSYRDAAKNYENAWKYGNKNSPVIGYKLAFNYMKARRFVDAIDICHHVLKTHPDYPKIRKDILDKARQSLRV